MPQEKMHTDEVDIDASLVKRIRVQGEVGAGGNTSVGVATEWEY